MRTRRHALLRAGVIWRKQLVTTCFRRWKANVKNIRRQRQLLKVITKNLKEKPPKIDQFFRAWRVTARAEKV